MKKKVIAFMVIVLLALPIAGICQPTIIQTKINYQFINCTIQQNPSNSNRSWAASAAMMVAWKEGTCPNVIDILNRVGEPYLSYYNGNQILDCTDFYNLLERLGMKVVKNFIPTPETWRNLIANGPVLTTVMNSNNSGHVVVVNYLYEDTTTNTYRFGYIDPLNGSQRYLDSFAFITAYENISAFCGVQFAYWPNTNFEEMLNLSGSLTPSAPGAIRIDNN